MINITIADASIDGAVPIIDDNLDPISEPCSAQSCQTNGTATETDPILVLLSLSPQGQHFF